MTPEDQPLREPLRESREARSTREGRRQRGSSTRRGRGDRTRRVRDDGAERHEAERSRPQREHVSAYLDESTVVRVSRRSERRGVRSSGFTLVDDAPERSERTRREERAARRESWRDADPAPSFGGFRRESASVAPSAWPDPYDSYGSHDSIRDDRVDEPVRRRRRGSSSYESLEARGLPGSRRRREALLDGVLAVPRGIVGALGELALHLRGALVALVVVLAVLMLYAPARELYVANRRIDALQATYDALLEENDGLRSDLTWLQSREGIEDVARMRGYVEPGETKVVVEGLPDEREGWDGIEQMVPEVEVPDTRSWYVRLFDLIFGYELGA